MSVDQEWREHILHQIELNKLSISDLERKFNEKHLLLATDLVSVNEKVKFINKVGNAVYAIVGSVITLAVSYFTRWTP